MILLPLMAIVFFGMMYLDACRRIRVAQEEFEERQRRRSLSTKTLWDIYNDHYRDSP